MDPRHEGVQRWVADLNREMKNNRPLHEMDFSQDGFQWVSRTDWEQSIIAFLRKDSHGNPVLVVCNFTPVPRPGYRVGVPCGGRWQELINSDAPLYGGSGVGNFGGVEAEAQPFDGQSHSISLSLPPLGAIFLKPA
jgi:1,4-alpha-glucan branching enzyme